MMLAPTFAFFLLAPQGDRPPFPSSRNLPDDRTLLSVELADPNLLWARAGQIAQLGMFRAEPVRRLLAWVGRRDPDFGRLLAAAPRLGDLVLGLDRGITFATMFTREHHGVTTFVVGTSSRAARLRTARQTFATLLAPLAGEAASCDHRRVPIPDTPVEADCWYQDRVVVGTTYRPHKAFYLALKGRSLGLYGVWDYLPDEARRDREVADTAARLGSLLGLGDVERGGWKLGTPPQLAEGQELLGRLAFRFRKTVTNAKYVPVSALADVEAAGLAGFDGVQSILFRDGGVLRERIEIRHGQVEKPSLFDIFDGGGRGLGDALGHLPRNALGALRIGFDATSLTDRIYALAALAGATEAGVAGTLRRVRALLGLGSGRAGHRPGLDGVGEIAVALLEPAAASPLPELALLVRVPPNPGQAARAVRSAARLVAAGAPSAPRVRTLGRGETAVRYVRLRDALADRTGSALTPIALGLLGGGFVSAGRAGPWFVLGFQPRTVRNLVRDTERGNVLAARDDLRARFPAGSGRAVEGFVDFPRLAGKLTLVETLLPALVFGGGGGPTLELPPVPRLATLAPYLRTEYLWSEKTGFGHVLHREGGTLLSPVAWAGLVDTVGLWSGVRRMLRPLR